MNSAARCGDISGREVERVRDNFREGVHDFNVQCLALATETQTAAAAAGKPSPSQDELVEAFIALPTMPSGFKEEYEAGVAMQRYVMAHT